MTRAVHLRASGELERAPVFCTVRPNLIALSRALLSITIAMTLGSCSDDRVKDDLTMRLAAARRQPSDAAFDIVNAATDRGETRCIRTQGATRLTYHVTVPKGATLSVWTPTIPSGASETGLTYLIGVADDHAYRAVASESTVPAPATPATKWRNSRFRLDEYEGMTINVVFNTRARESSTAPPGVGLWCSPAILVH